METLLPVIVGGIIGLLGGLVGPPMAHWLNEGAARKKKRAEKLEELISALYAYDHWLDVIRGIRCFGNEGREPPSPLAQARAIALIYFPDLESWLSELEEKARPYEIWMLETAQKRIGGQTQNLAEGFDAVYQPYRGKLMEIVKELKTFARSEFGS